jgi:phosphoglycerate kinase
MIYYKYIIKIGGTMKKTIRDYDLNNKKVIIRCDLNVPIKDGVITDDNRIKESIKTIQYAIDNNSKVIILSHLGRVKTEEDKKKNTLEPIAKRLSELLNKKVIFIPYTRGKELEDAINKLNNGDVLLLENTRFEDIDGDKESSNDKELGEYWASLGNIFINDAFGTSHRAHASNVGIASNLPNGVGFLVEKEINILYKTIEDPKRPFMVILGGAKVSDKIGVIENLVKIADKIIIGGGMAYTFLKANNLEIGKSILDAESIDFAKSILENYADKIVLPIDTNVALEYKNDSLNKIVDVNNIASDEMGLDIGPKTIELFKNVLSDAQTVIWNGPMGVFEFDKFSNGTKEICEYLADMNITTIIGGGDSAAFVTEYGYKQIFTHVSTGGGASLELLEGKKLPGIEVISNI